MAIYRGTGGSLDGLVESEVILLAISQGGTGSSTASGARTNLGLGTAATTDASAYATAAQGAKADTATQPGDLGTAAAEDVGYFATAAQGALADSAVQPGDLATVATSGSYNDLTDKPTAGSGTVTSVGMTVPTGLAVSGSPVTTTGTLAVTYATGYAIPTTAKQTNWDTAYGWGNHATAGYLTTETYTGTVTSVAMTVPTGLSVSGTPITSTGTLAVTLTAGYSIPTTSSQTNWDTAYTDRLKWDGGSTGLTASTGRTSLGATTVGSNLFTLADPSAITFVRLNADNTVSALNASDFRTAIGAGTSSTTGTVTSVAALTLGTTGTDVSSTVATGTTTPVITLNIPTASATNRGALSSADWSTFNGKQAALVSGTNIKTVNSNSLLGSGNISVGTVASVSGTGTVNGLTLTGTVTSSGSLTLGGTLDLSSPPAIGGTTPSTGNFTTLRVGSASILGNSNADVTLGLTVRNSGASTGYLQTYNANAGTDLKTWRMGGNSSGSFVFETVNDAYSSSTNRMTLDSSGNLTATTFNGTVDGGTY